MFRFLAFFFAVFVAALAPPAAFATPAYITFPADIDWVTQDSAHFRVLYRKGEALFAARALQSAEKAYRLLRPIFPDAPPMTWIVLGDYNDALNGYSLDVPWAHTVLYAVPPEPTSELAWMDGWLDSLILHEYVHTLHIIPASGLWKPLRSVFGSWVLPNGLLPMHFHEGLAVLFESEFTQGGRGKSPYFRMMRRMAVDAGRWNRDAHPLDRMDGTPNLWPGGTAAYFYGYYMYAELWKRKGEKGIHDLVVSSSSNWPGFFQNGPLEEVYGLDYPTLWDGIFEKTGKEERQEIEAIKKTPLSPLTYLTDSHFYKSDLALSPDAKKAIYRKGNPEEGGSFEELDLETGKVMDQFRFHAGPLEGMCWGKSPKGERLVFLREVTEDLYTSNRLAAYDLTTKKTWQWTDSMTKEPVKHLRLLGCSKTLERMLVYREFAGKGELQELVWNGELDEAKVSAKLTPRHWDLPMDSWISGLVVGAPDWIALRQGMTTTLYRWDQGATVPSPVMELKNHAYHLRPGNQPNELYAIASFDGRDEVWSIDTAARTAHKVVGLLGGVLSFERRPDDFIVSSYRDGGYDIAKASPLSSQPGVPIAAQWKASTRVVASPPTLSEENPYSAWETLAPHMWFATLLFVPNGLQVGAYVPGFDIAQKNLYDLAGGYDTRGQPYALGDYSYRFSNRLALVTSLSYLPSYIYTSLTFLKQWGATAGIDWQPSPVLPHVLLGTIFQRKESSDLFGPANQGVGVTVGLTKSFGLEQRPLDVDPRKGTTVSINHAQFLQGMGSTDNYFLTTIGIDQYIPAPWWNSHVFYIGLRGGFTEGTGIYNSYFQAGGDIEFYEYREYFLNRGFEYVAFPFSRRIANLNLEYRFPLWRVERGIALWPIFLNGIHMSLVSDTTTRDLGTEAPGDPYSGIPNYIFQRYYVSAGAELKTDWTLGYYFPGQLIVGAYHGFGPAGENLYVTVGVQAAI